MPNRPPGSCGQLLSIRRSVAPNELSHRPYSHSNPHASRLPFVSSCRQTPSLDPPSNEVVGIPCAPFALGLLVTGLLAGGITTSPLTSTYPWVRSEPMSTNTARSLRKVSHGDLLSPPLYSTACAILCQPAVWWVTSAERSRSIFGKRRRSSLFCNIHPQRSAVVVTVNTPYYCVSDAEGRISIPDVP